MLSALPMGPLPLRWLVLDMNSFFASCEQHLNPALAGKPVIVVPVDSDTTCAIAASSEAKRFGIKTNTPVWEARRLCPELRVVLARHDAYVELHERIVAEVENHVPVTTVLSIDEMACELWRNERTPEAAIALAHAIKAGLRDKIGTVLRCSIGIAPSRLLAKIASDRQKPDGLTLFPYEELPELLYPLALTDLPGIANNMERRLHAAGIHSVQSFLALPPTQARQVWGSIEGERFWYALHGIDPPETASDPVNGRRQISHSHVLAPELRPVSVARLVARRLLVKAASRMRRYGLLAGGLALSVRSETGERYGGDARFAATGDNFALLKSLEELWLEMRMTLAAARVKKTGVVLWDLQVRQALTPDLFGETPRIGEDPKGRALSETMDQLNHRFGRDAVMLGLMPKRLPRYTGTKIAFNRIPEKPEFKE